MSTPLLVEASSLIDALADAMRRQIIDGGIPPGDRLTELWVSTTYQVARPTAKAALDRLTNEGLLRRGPRKSAIVPRLTADDVFDIYFSREPVESSAVTTLASQAQLPPDAEYALTLMTVAAASDQHAAHTQADIAFHRALVSAVESPRLRRMHDTVMGEAQLCIAQVRSHIGLDLVRLTADHAAIAEAIRSGDSAAAVAALQHDLHGCRDLLLADVRRAEESRASGADDSADETPVPVS
jgi:DNA-binding GntR family transcriptional regulator